MHPLARSVLGVQNGTANKLGTDPPPLEISPHPRIEQERVVTTVPSDVDKADKTPIVRDGL